jgi:hypothetical protein
MTLKTQSLFIVMLSVVMLSIVMLSVVMLSVVMLSVVMLSLDRNDPTFVTPPMVGKESTVVTVACRCSQHFC